MRLMLRMCLLQNGMTPLVLVTKVNTAYSKIDPDAKEKSLEVLHAHGARMHSLISAAKEDLFEEVASIIAQGADLDARFYVRYFVACSYLKLYLVWFFLPVRAYWRFLIDVVSTCIWLEPKPYALSCVWLRPL